MNDDKLRCKHLAYLRSKNGLSQLDLANLLHYSDKNISKWENGKSFPTDPDILNNLAKIFNVSVDEIIYGYEKVNEISDKSFYSKFKDFLSKYKIIILFILFSILLNFIVSCFCFNNYYAVISNDNIYESHININFGKEFNIFKFYKLESVDKRILLLHFYCKSNNNEHIFYELKNRNLILRENNYSLEYNFRKVINSSCYLKIIYNDESFDIVNIKFNRIL